jgi:hypothetical protein
MKGFPAACIALCGVAITGYIAFRQLETNKEKLRLDLYNKRFEILEKTIKFSQAISSYVKYNEENKFDDIFEDFIKAKIESKFLFKENSGIYQILEKFHEIAFKVKYVFSDDYRNQPNSPEKVQSYQEMTHGLMYIITSLDNEVIPKMKEYLNINHIVK